MTEKATKAKNIFLVNSVLKLVNAINRNNIVTLIFKMNISKYSFFEFLFKNENPFFNLLVQNKQYSKIK